MSTTDGTSMSDLVPNFRDERVTGAMRNLLFYSMTVIAVPLGSMFLLKSLFFEALLGFTAQDAMLYAAIVAVILVHVVLGLWLYTAYDSDAPSQKKVPAKVD